MKWLSHNNRTHGEVCGPRRGRGRGAGTMNHTILDENGHSFYLLHTSRGVMAEHGDQSKYQATRLSPDEPCPPAHLLGDKPWNDRIMGSCGHCLLHGPPGQLRWKPADSHCLGMRPPKWGRLAHRPDLPSKGSVPMPNPPSRDYKHC